MVEGWAAMIIKKLVRARRLRLYTYPPTQTVAAYVLSYLRYCLSLGTASFFGPRLGFSLHYTCYIDGSSTTTTRSLGFTTVSAGWWSPWFCGVHKGVSQEVTESPYATRIKNATEDQRSAEQDSKCGTQCCRTVDNRNRL